jgi:hypothetical protein
VLYVRLGYQLEQAGLINETNVKQAPALPFEAASLRRHRRHRPRLHQQSLAAVEAANQAAVMCASVLLLDASVS